MGVPKDAVFEKRGEERENIFTKGRTKNKKKKSLHISHAHLPPPRIILQNGIRFTNQRRRGDKKEDRRPEEDHGQEGALASLSRGSFSDRIPMFFFRLSLAQNGFVFFFQREEKKRDQKTNQKSATFASSRRVEFVPQNRPFDAVKRAHRTPKCTGSTSVRALTPRHPSRGGREDLSSGVCVCSKNKSRKRFAKFLSSKTHQSTQTNRTMGKKREGEEILFLVRF